MVLLEQISPNSLRDSYFLLDYYTPHALILNAPMPQENWFLDHFHVLLIWLPYVH